MRSLPVGRLPSPRFKATDAAARRTCFARRETSKAWREVCASRQAPPEKETAHGHRPRSRYAATDLLLPESLTDTSFDTPGSSIVTPYSVSTDSMVRLLWVMRMNCDALAISFTSSL
jgi:hypothetical protein